MAVEDHPIHWLDDRGPGSPIPVPTDWQSLICGKAPGLPVKSKNCRAGLSKTMAHAWHHSVVLPQRRRAECQTTKSKKVAGSNNVMIDNHTNLDI